MGISGDALTGPTRVKRMARESIAIDWDNGHQSIFPNRYLRENCPCAGCREENPGLSLPIRNNGEIYPTQIGVVGRYALSIQWSDGHDTGIYAYTTLLGLCPCPKCRPSTVQEDRE